MNRDATRKRLKELTRDDLLWIRAEIDKLIQPVRPRAKRTTGQRTRGAARDLLDYFEDTFHKHHPGCDYV